MASGRVFASMSPGEADTAFVEFHRILNHIPFVNIIRISLMLKDVNDLFNKSRFSNEFECASHFVHV